MRKAGGRVAMLAAVAAVAGCGGSSTLSKSEYQQKLTEQGTQLKNAVSDLNFQNTADLDALASKLDSAQKQIDDAADKIDDLNPPKDAAKDNDKIASSLHAFADVFRKMRDAAKAGERSKITPLLNQLAKPGQEGQEATNDLKSKGYDVGEFGQ